MDPKNFMVTKYWTYFLEMRPLWSQVGFHEFFFKLKNLFSKMDKKNVQKRFVFFQIEKKVVGLPFAPNYPIFVFPFCFQRVSVRIIFGLYVGPTAFGMSQGFAYFNRPKLPDFLFPFCFQSKMAKIHVNGP